MAFEDLLLPDAEIVVGEFISWTVGTRLRIPYTIVDSDESTMRFASGYTASMTLNLSDGTNVVTFTETLTDGRVIDLNPSGIGEEDTSLVIRATQDGMTACAPYARRNLIFNLTITRTADDFPIDVMSNCYISVQPAND